MEDSKISRQAIIIDPRLHHFLCMLEILDGAMVCSSTLHQSLLENQSQTLNAISDLTGISQSINLSRQGRQAVISKQQLEEFAMGSIAKCFGTKYKVLDHRKTPRIPNGRLLLMDRVVEISGRRMDLTSPASIVTEFDIQQDAWFIQANTYSGIPLAVLIEIALQPCGILSAYLGTSLVIPPENNLFRNLDGWIKTSSIPELRGKTVTNRAELIKTIASAGLYIQAFRFKLSANGQPFLSGESSFGYFTQPVMDKQSGLDLSEKQTKIIKTSSFPEEFQEISKAYIYGETDTESKSLLNLLDRLWLSSKGGRYGQGVVIGQKTVQGNEWFFENHFYQDPVMPGSLGIEAITHGLWAFIKNGIQEIKNGYASIAFSDDKPLLWKYRGQVLPSNRETYFELHIKEKDVSNRQPRISADADFWTDDLRIYSLENLAMTLKEGMNNDE